MDRTTELSDETTENVAKRRETTGDGGGGHDLIQATLPRFDPSTPSPWGTFVISIANDLGYFGRKTKIEN